MPVDLEIPTIGREKRKTNRCGFVEKLQFRRPRLARLERSLVLTALGKQSSKYIRAQRNSQNAGLSHQDALADREARLTENADSERCCPNDRKSDDERGRGTKNRLAAGRKP